MRGGAGNAEAMRSGASDEKRYSGVDSPTRASGGADANSDA